MSETPQESRVLTIRRPRVALYGQDTSSRSWQERILAKEAAQPGDEEQTSNQGTYEGEVPRPFNYEEARKFRTQNGHHSSCVASKIQASIGLGFKGPRREATAQQVLAVAEGRKRQEDLDEDLDEDSPVYAVLDPLCDISFQDVFQDVIEDFIELGVGYIEVVRDVSGKIRGLHHCPAHHTTVYRETRHDYHYLVQGPGLSLEDGRTDVRFARFGDLDSYRVRNSIGPAVAVSELIAIRQASSRSKVYGFPDWLAAVPSVELVQMHRQHSYDFYNNRGVPEFMLFVLGQKLPEKDWALLQDAVQANIGQGNSYKSVVINLEGDPETLKIQMERLGLDGGASTEGQFQEVTDSLAMDIVSAHRVPPLLAGIMIPGKLGASNELVNALIAFQELVIGPFQKTICSALKNSLGDTEKAGLGLDPKDFKLRTIVDKFDLKKMDTVSKMKQPMQEAQAEGRDLTAGRKE